MPLLRIDKVVKRFGGAVAVAGVSLDVEAGEFFSMLGPSGCGKTTLLRMIAGFENPDEGRIELDGTDIRALPPHRRPINTVFQQYALFPHLNVFENVAFGLRRAQVGEAELRRRVTESLDQVQLGTFAERMPAMLSGGQKQRVALARALVLRPRLLLLDEPLGALDHQLRLQMQVELKNLQRASGITFLFVTHDQPEALTMSDRIAVFSRGHIEQAAPARAVYDEPATPFVARFLGASNLLSAEVLRVADGTAQVQLTAGPKVLVKAPYPTVVGSTVSVMLRPEWLGLSRGLPEGRVGAPAVVRDRLYQGASTRYTLATLGMEDLEVVLTPGFGAVAEDLMPGTSGVVSWPDGTGVIVPASPER